MVAPGGGVLIAYHENVLAELVDSCSWVFPDVKEEDKGVDVQLGFYRKLS